MDYNEFKKQLLEQINNKLKNAEIRSYTKINNITKEGIFIPNEEKNCIPLIHLDDLFRLYELSGDIETIVEIVLAISNTSQTADIQKIFGSWENAQSRLNLRVINSKWNRDILEDLPHRNFMDLSLVVYMDFIRNQEEIVSTAVTPDIMKLWKVDEETLFHTAFINLQKEKFIIRDMEEIIQEMRGGEILPTPYDGINYVMTNAERKYGARGMLRTDMLIQFAESVHADLYILPNSLDDIILTPVRPELADEILNDMMAVIKVFNKPEQDSLSDNIYYFNRESKTISVYTSETV